MSYGDVRDVIAALPHRFPPGDSYAFTDIFTERYRLLQELDPQPTSVFEFGALFGYFLVTALVACPSIERVGWVDNQSACPGSNGFCAANVLSVQPDLETLTFARSWEDLEVDDPLSGEAVPWDVVSVDGDHSFDGCRTDLLLAFYLEPRLIFVDDWDAATHRDEIRAAVESVLAPPITVPKGWDVQQPPGSAYELTDVIHTQNGLAVLRRRGTA